jgi:hypothetical protein
VLLELVVDQRAVGEAIDDCTDISSVHGADEGRDGLRKARAVGIRERHGASSSDSKVVVTPRACPTAANGRVKTCEES